MFERWSVGCSVEVEGAFSAGLPVPEGAWISMGGDRNRDGGVDVGIVGRILELGRVGLWCWWCWWCWWFCYWSDMGCSFLFVNVNARISI